MDNVIRGNNWYFDVLNTWRVLDEVSIPALERAMEAFTPGGHMMGVEWPEELQALKATIKLRNDDPRVRGLLGREPGNYITSTYYENLLSYRTGENKGRVVALKGLLTAVKPDARKGLKASGTEYDFSTLVFYHDIYDGRTVHKFDYFAGPGATVINGEMPYAAMAQNLSIAGGTAL